MLKSTDFNNTAYGFSKFSHIVFNNSKNSIANEEKY